MLPWLESLIARYLLTDGGRVISAVPLASVVVPLGVDELVSTDKQSIAVHSRTVQAPARDGVYWMRRAGAVVGALVVNAEPAESNLAPLDKAALAERITGPKPQVLAPTENVAHAAFSTAGRRPLVGLLLVALVVLLIVESLVARETRDRRPERRVVSLPLLLDAIAERSGVRALDGVAPGARRSRDRRRIARVGGRRARGRARPRVREPFHRGGRGDPPRSGAMARGPRSGEQRPRGRAASAA